MANLRELKEKKISVDTIHKITSSMEVLSITKSRIATKNLNKYKEYINTLDQIVQSLITNIKDNDKKFDKTLWLLFNSDLGLAGGFNNGVVKKLLSELDIQKDKVIVLGQKGVSLLGSKVSKDLITSYSHDDLKNINIVEEIVAKILEHYQDNDFKVNVVYTHYVSQVSFEPTIFQLLPIVADDKVEKINGDIEYEPNVQTILKDVLSTYIPSKLRYFFRNSLASEHTSRRIAMENATKNGEELLKSLSVEYNRARQAKITQEILEILGGAESLK